MWSLSWHPVVRSKTAGDSINRTPSKLNHPTVAMGHAAFQRADEFARYADLADGLAFANRGVVSLLSSVHTLPNRRCGFRRVSSSSAPAHGHEMVCKNMQKQPWNERLGLDLPHLFLLPRVDILESQLHGIPCYNILQFRIYDT